MQGRKSVEECRFLQSAACSFSLPAVPNQTFRAQSEPCRHAAALHTSTGVAGGLVSCNAAWLAGCRECQQASAICAPDSGEA